MEGGMRERSGRDYENLSSLKTLVFMRVLRDLLREMEGFLAKTLQKVQTKVVHIAIKSA